jgi:hypothetical protein
MMRSLALLVICAACSTLDPIERGVCGNGLIEPGEDCDSHDPTCVACAVTCTAVADCPNAAYTCGVDGLCHAPSGVLAPATPPSLFLYDEVRITDIDHDGINDVVGASKTSLAVRYGDKQSALTSSIVVETPPATGPTAFGDLDGDGSQDAALVTSDGIVAYTSPYGSPTPATSFTPLQVGGTSIPMRATFPLRGVAVGTIVQDPGSGALFIDIVEYTTTGTTGQPGSLCGLPGADFTPDDIDVYQASASSDTTIDVVLAVFTKGTSGRHWCVSSIHLDAPDGTNTRTAHFNDITPTGAVPTRKPIWANLDTGSAMCPWLINSDGGGPGLKAYIGSTAGAVLGNPAHCTVATTATALPNAPDATALAAGVGHIPFKPGFPFVAQDVLVLSSTAYLYSSIGPTFTEVYKTERTLAHVASGDLDGDKAIDAVLSAKDDDDLEVVYRAGGGLVPGFIVYRLDTTGVVANAYIDDYDGNGLADIAYVENLLGHQSLSVAYSMPGHAFDKVTAAQFVDVLSIIPLQVPDSSDPFGAIGDLFVLEQVGSSIALTLLHGTPQQVMLSFFDPRADNDNFKNVIMREVAIGDFVMSAGSTQYRDVLAFLPDAAPGASTAGISVYRLDGTANGLDPSDTLNAVANGRGGEHLDGIDDCALGAATGTGAACIRNAKLISWVTGQAHDIVIGIDRQPTPKAFVIDPWQFAPGGAMTVTDAGMLTAMVPPGAQVQSARAVDVDGDSANELVVSFAPAETASATGAGLVEVCQMNTNGTPRTCTDLLPAIQQVAPKLTTCVDAQPGHFIPVDPIDPPPTGAQLLVLCHDSGAAASIARVVWTGSAYEATLVASNLGPLREIKVGDINGDGVDDVVAIRGDAEARSLTVFAQCESRDVTCQATGVAP